MRRTRAAAIGGFGCAVFVGAAVFGGCARGADSLDGSTPSNSTGGAATRGPEAFKHCVGCHSADGSGSDLAPQIQNPVAGFASYVARHGRNEMGYPSPMPPFETDTVSDDELSEIWAWLDEAPHPSDGDGLYVRFCANCHGSDAKGGRVGEDIAGVEADEVTEKVRKGHAGNDYGDRTKYMPAWSTDALTDTEVGLIADYLRSLTHASTSTSTSASTGGGDGDGDGDDD